MEEVADNKYIFVAAYYFLLLNKRFKDSVYGLRPIIGCLDVYKKKV